MKLNFSMSQQKGSCSCCNFFHFSFMLCNDTWRVLLVVSRWHQESEGEDKRVFLVVLAFIHEKVTVIAVLLALFNFDNKKQWWKTRWVTFWYNKGGNFSDSLLSQDFIQIVMYCCEDRIKETSCVSFIWLQLFHQNSCKQVNWRWHWQNEIILCKN